MDLREYFSKRPRIESDTPVDAVGLTNSLDLQAVASAPPFIHEFDIANYVNKPVCDSIDSIIGLQDKIWIPPENYKFPQSGQRNLKFQRSWLGKYPWLSYSSKEDGAYCKCCVIFGARYAGVGSQSLGKLVLKPCNNWKNALEIFKSHQNLEYHKTALIKSTTRAAIEKHNSKSVDTQLSKQKEDYINKSKQLLVPIIEAVILCGRQGLALRGSQDSGRITEEEPTNNDGNFRALLRYRAKGDQQFKANLENTQQNAMYISNRIQNELIAIRHKEIQDEIVNRVNKSQAFSILGDETADIAGIEQMSVCVRYIYNDEGVNKLCEDFLTFIPVEDSTGQGLSNTLLNYLESTSINCEYFFGQGYDGARSMSGEFHGAQAYIRQKYPLALYCHCAAHCFNLAVNDSCRLNEVKNCLVIIEAVYTFFHYPKRQLAFQKAIENNEKLAQEPKKKLKKFCATRWVQQHEAVATYIQLQPAVIDALEDISSTWKDSKTSSEAFQLLSSIKAIIFQVTLQILFSVNSITLPLSRVLQEVDQDLVEAIQLADFAKEKLLLRRQNATENFSKIWQTVNEICAEYDISVQIPKVSQRQLQRSNGTSENFEDYFRIRVYIPFLDTFVTHLQDRFLKHRNILSNFACLFQNQMEEVNENSCKALFGSYASILHDQLPQIWIDEVTMWKRFIADKGVSNAIEALDLCKSSSFPNVSTVLRIMAVLPVTTAANERSFSTLRRLKTYLRSTQTNDRLTGLASINIHRGIKLSAEKIAEEFVSIPRRLNLLTK